MAKMPQNDKNWAKKIFFPYSPKSSPNHMKLSVDVRNEVYNWFRVLLVLDSLYSFDNLNNQFRACFWPKVKNLTCTIPSVNPIGHLWLGTLFSTIFMQKIREVTRVSKNFCEFPSVPYLRKFNYYPLGFLNTQTLGF